MLAAKNPWFYYRLADMVKFNNHIFGRRAKRGRELHYKLYPKSIASQYMRKTNKSNNYDVLTDLVNKYPEDIKPKSDELILHLRVGEVIDGSRYTVNELLAKQRTYINDLTYVKPMCYYENILDEILNMDISKIIIVAGGCLTHRFTKSEKYIQKIENFFLSSGLDVQVRFGRSPDEDFVFMCRSKFFIPSGGGFSSMIKDINTIIKPI